MSVCLFFFSLADILKSYCWKVFRRHWVHWIARHHYHRISSLVSCHFECLCYACLDAQRYLLTVRHSTEKQKFKSSALECLDSAMYHGHLWTSMDIYGPRIASSCHWCSCTAWWIGSLPMPAPPWCITCRTAKTMLINIEGITDINASFWFSEAMKLR